MEKEEYAITLVLFSENNNWHDSWHTRHDIVMAYNAEDVLRVFKQDVRNHAFLSLGKMVSIDITRRAKK